MISTLLRDFRLLAQRWQVEHAQVVDEAGAASLERIRWLGPLIVAINSFHTLVFLLLALRKSPDIQTPPWEWALCGLHLAMGLTMATLTWMAHHKGLRYRRSLARWMAPPVALVLLGFAVAIACVDQWVTPSVTPFLIACLCVSVGLYLRPVAALVVFSLAYIGFFIALGHFQDEPRVLLSIRLNGFTACLMAWALSVLLWRNFTTIAMQRAQVARVNTELQTKQRELERLTRQDGLTGLFNRNTFVELSSTELKRALRQGSATTILLFDLDHFKRINDTWGHPAGDAMLRHVAQTSVQSVRSTDLVGRLGGEEFIVLLPHTHADAGRRIAEKIRQRLEASPLNWNGEMLHITASFGLSSATAAEGRSFDHLYNEADKALYLAKQRGRNRVI
ncbi:MAG: GGDEF domain-containing protein [Rhodoferax sp.]|uniref:GGDEF domain-containing protein n=1 Tax=Rhodoferax sp. TaxID=50421 RepID=UPI002ACE76DA|nr:GGDEF domain-containing protein [Rhodoferax sp.]MDZ7890506.1 GGDEF domain-containing protein [Rhodoferax sp.]